MYPKHGEDMFDYTNQGRVWCPYDALAASNLDVVFDFGLAGLSHMHSRAGWKFSEIVQELGYRYSDIAHQDLLVPARSVDDIRTAHEDGTIAFVPGLESTSMIENELDRIDVLHGIGVRIMGVTYMRSNMLGTGEKDMGDGDGGLTGFGHQAVERMNKVGIAPSVTHASDQTTLDVCEASDGPVLLTHAGAQAVLDVPQLATDEMLRAVADTGGVIGVKSNPHTTASAEHPRSSIESVMDHFEYIVDLVGIDHVTFGTDAIYGDHVQMHETVAFGGEVSPPYEWHEDIERIEYVKGMENPTEAWHNVVRWLVKEGYSDDEIRKVLGENTLQALEAAW
jgi:membrane dipeptidase